MPGPITTASRLSRQGDKAFEGQGLPQDHLNALFGKLCRGVLEGFVFAPFENNNVAILLLEQTRGS